MSKRTHDAWRTVYLPSPAVHCTTVHAFLPFPFPQLHPEPIRKQWILRSEATRSSTLFAFLTQAIPHAMLSRWRRLRNRTPAPHLAIILPPLNPPAPLRVPGVQRWDLGLDGERWRFEGRTGAPLMASAFEGEVNDYFLVPIYITDPM